MTPAEGVLLRVSGLPCDKRIVVVGGVCDCLGCDARRGLKDFAEVVKSRDELLKACKLALRWLLNCVPTVALDGPKPLPTLYDAISNAEKKP